MDLAILVAFRLSMANQYYHLHPSQHNRLAAVYDFVSPLTRGFPILPPTTISGYQQNSVPNAQTTEIVSTAGGVGCLQPPTHQHQDQSVDSPELIAC